MGSSVLTVSLAGNNQIDAILYDLKWGALEGASLPLANSKTEDGGVLDFASWGASYLGSFHYDVLATSLIGGQGFNSDTGNGFSEAHDLGNPGGFDALFLDTLTNSSSSFPKNIFEESQLGDSESSLTEFVRSARETDSHDGRGPTTEPLAGNPDDLSQLAGRAAGFGETTSQNGNSADAVGNHFAVADDDSLNSLTDLFLKGNPGPPASPATGPFGSASTASVTITSLFGSPASAPSVPQSDAGAAGSSFTTTGSNIPIWTIGQVVASGEDTAIFPQSNVSGPLISLDTFRADARFLGIDGSGYTTVIIDTGIDLNHSFFGPDSNSDGIADRIVFQHDFADGDTDASDVHGHGSNVSSIVASSDATFTGMAPGANIVALKVFQDSGAGFFSYIEQALQWVVSNAATYNIVSINMSIGDSGNYTTPQALYDIADEMAALAALDVITVSASGNEFFGFNSVQGVSYPSADANSLSIGAVYDSNAGGFSYIDGAIAFTTGQDEITPFSQRDVNLTTTFAPGAPITGANWDGGTVTFHGTSQASPHVAGIAVLAQQLAMQELGRKLTVTEFADLLSQTGATINDGDDEDGNVTNTGLDFSRVDVLALGDAILALKPPPPSLSISALDAVQAEGDAGTTALTFTVTRSGDTSGATDVDYGVAGSGAAPADGADFGGVLPSGTVNFAANETSKVVTVDVTGDTDVETDEEFTVTLSNATGGAQIGTAAATGTIQNDDATEGQVTLLEAHFDTDAEGFTYLDGVFGGANPQAYADGTWTGGALQVTLGGIDGADIFNMSGGWQQTFSLAAATDVSLSFLYNLTQSEPYDADENSDVLVSVDGGPATLVARDIGGPPSAGWQTYAAALGTLATGSHSLTIGGFNNKKTLSNEHTTILFDDVIVTGAATASGQETAGTYIEGSKEDDTLVGTSDSDTLQGGAGNDALFGAEGDDLFVFSSGTGHDTVGDFTPGVATEDRLDLSAFDFDDVSDVMARVQDDGTDVTVDLGEGDQITLLGVQVSNLHEDDFLL